MFFGEACLLLVLRCKLSKDKVAKAAHEHNKISPFVFALPALIDTYGVYLNLTGLALISASSFQMLKMLSTVFVVILSVTVLKKSYNKMQYFAITLVLGGLTIVALTDVYGGL